MIEQISHKVTTELVKQKDDIILSALKDFLKVEEIDINDLEGRCSSIVVGSSEKTIYLIDDKPFIEFDKSVFGQVQDEKNQFLYRVNQNYRRLF